MRVIHYGTEKPEELTIQIRLAQRQRTVRFSISEVEGDENYKWQWEEVTLPPGVWDYGSVVAAIIGAHYTADEMTATINNYLLEPRTAGAEEEMAAMQQWRAYAKETARRLLGQ